MSVTRFDTRALTEPVDRRTVAAHRRQLVASGRARAGIIVIAVVTVTFFALQAGLLGLGTGAP